MRLGISIPAIPRSANPRLILAPCETSGFDFRGGGHLSRIFGAVCQNGYVVRDIRAAMDHWVNVMGVGPWYYIDRVKID